MTSTQTRAKSTSDTGSSLKWSSLPPASTCTCGKTSKIQIRWHTLQLQRQIFASIIAVGGRQVEINVLASVVIKLRMYILSECVKVQPAVFSEGYWTLRTALWSCDWTCLPSFSYSCHLAKVPSLQGKQTFRLFSTKPNLESGSLSFFVVQWTVSAIPRWVITALWIYSFIHWRGERKMSWCLKWTVNNRNACSRTPCGAWRSKSATGASEASHCWWHYLGADYQNSKAGKRAQDDVGQHCRSPAKEDRMSKFMWMKIIVIRSPFHFTLSDSYIHDKHECSTVAWWSLKIQFEFYWHLAVIIQTARIK